MSARIISIGTELTLGQTVDTNAPWIAQQLAGVGIACGGHVTVPDDRHAIHDAIKSSVRDAKWVVITGGLGPTPDDLTREALADALDSTLMIRRPAGYTPADGAHFELHYDKLRGSGGAQAQPLKIQLQADGADRWLWTHRTLEQSLFEKVTALLAEEYSQKDIAIELGINKATVCKYAKRAAQGELP